MDRVVYFSTGFSTIFSLLFSYSIHTLRLTLVCAALNSVRFYFVPVAFVMCVVVVVHVFILFAWCFAIYLLVLLFLVSLYSHTLVIVRCSE